jgi:hypothetical protein
MKSVWYLFVFTPLAVFGSLVWQSTEVDYRASPGETSASVTYTFTNTGMTAVHILGVRPSCSCTKARTDKLVYQPGEMGEVSATFNFGRRVGHQVINIDVLADDSDSSDTTLTLAAEIP